MKKILNNLLMSLLLIINIFTINNVPLLAEEEIKESDYIYNLFTQSSLESVIGFSWENADIMVQIRSYADSNGLNRGVFCIEPGYPTIDNASYTSSHTAPTLYKGSLDINAATNVLMNWAYKHKGDLNYSYAELTAIQLAIWGAETGHSPNVLVIRSGLTSQGISNANAVKSLATTLYNERNDESWKGSAQLYDFTNKQFVNNGDGLTIDTDHVYTIGGIKYYKTNTYAYKTHGYAGVDNISATVASGSDINSILVDANKNVVAIYVPVSEIDGITGTKYLKIKFSCSFDKAAPLYFDSPNSQAFITPDVVSDNKDTTLTFSITKNEPTYSGVCGEISWNKVGLGPTDFEEIPNAEGTGETLYEIKDWEETSLRGGKFSLMNEISTNTFETLVTFINGDQGYFKYVKDNLDDDIDKNGIGLAEIEAPKGYVLSLNSAYAQETSVEGGQRAILNAYAFDKSTAVSNVVVKNSGNPYKLTNTPKHFSVTVHKKDQNSNNVKGAVYGLYTTEEIVIGGTYDIQNIKVIPADSLVDIATTDNNGNAVLGGNNIPATQNYVIRELSSPDGYDMNPEELIVNLADFIADQSDTDAAKNKTITIEATDNKYTIGDISTNAFSRYIKNVVDYQGIKLKTVVKNSDNYSIYDDVKIKNTTSGSYKLIAKAYKKSDSSVLATAEKEFDITNETETNVEVEIKNMNFNSLNLNEKVVIGEELYRLQYKWNSQAKTIEAYYVKVGEHFDLNDINQTLTVVGYGNIDISKTDETGSLFLSGAKFDLIYKEEENSANPTVVARVTTGDDGKVRISNVASGSYSLIETQAPTGYIKTSNPIEVNLNVTNNGTTTESKTVKNSQSDYVVKVAKKDAANNTLGVAGAKYGLFNKSSSHLDETATTDNNGNLEFSNLTHGTTYYVKETQAPEGYEINNTKYTFTVNNDTFIADPVTTIKTFNISTSDMRESNKGSILIKKVDGDNLPLAGALFYIYDNLNSANKLLTPLSVGLSNANGEIKLTELEPGAIYYIVEFEAPLGYTRDSKVHKVTVIKKSTVTLTVKNTKNKTENKSSNKATTIEVVNTSVK